MITAITIYIILKVITFNDQDQQPKDSQLFMDIVGMFIIIFSALAIIIACYMDIQIAHILQSFVHLLQ